MPEKSQSEEVFSLINVQRRSLNILTLRIVVDVVFDNACWEYVLFKLSSHISCWSIASHYVGVEISRLRVHFRNGSYSNLCRSFPNDLINKWKAILIYS